MLLDIEDDMLLPEGRGGARKGSGVEGLEDALELGRPTEVPPTERQTKDSAADSRSSAREGRVFAGRALESLAWKPMVGTAAHEAGSFSLSGETDVAPCKGETDVATCKASGASEAA